MKTIVSIFLGLLVFSMVYGQCDNTAAYKATVIRVTDADTIHVMRADGTKAIIRFAAVDTPESDQAFGPEAAAVTKRLYGGQVTVAPVITKGEVTVDRYKRTIANVYSNGVDINAELLAAGLAWNYLDEQHPDKDKYRLLVDNAKKAGIGIWSLPNPIPPTAWRKMVPKPSYGSAKCPTINSCK